MTNYTANNVLNQALFTQNTTSYINSLTFAGKRALNALLKFANIYLHIDPSQRRLAQEAGISRPYLNQLYQKFVRDGLFVYKYKHRYTNHYVLNPIFFNTEFRIKHRNLLPNLNWLPDHHLLAATIAISLNMFTFNSNSEHHLNKSIYLKKKKDGIISLKKTSDSRETSDISLIGYTPTTNRKEESNKMLQEEIKEVRISAFLTSMAKKLKLSEEEEVRLSLYSDEILKFAFSKYESLLHVKREKGETIDNAFRYIFNQCSKEAERKASLPKVKIIREAEAPSTPSNIRKELPKTVDHSVPTALKLAEELTKATRCLNMQVVNTPMLNLVEETKRRLTENIIGLLQTGYTQTGEQGEDIALMVIERYTKLYNPPPLPVKKTLRDKLESNTTNETPLGNILDQKDTKDSTMVKFKALQESLANKMKGNLEPTEILGDDLEDMEFVEIEDYNSL